MKALDWSIVAVYLSVVLVLGLFASRRVNRAFDYFLAGRTLGVWAVMLSIIATETSAATVIGGPDTSFRGNLAYLQTTIGAVLSRFFLAYFFIDVFYRYHVYTVYGFLARRFGRAVQVFSSLLFCFGRLFASAARLYIAAFAASTIASVSLEAAILYVGVVALVYGVLGGLRAVVWTDMIQGVVFLGVGVFSLVYIVSELGGADAAYASLVGTNKLVLFDFNFNIFSADFWKNPYTFLGGVLGGFVLGSATHGTDQDMVQRMLACRTSKEGRKSLVLAGLLEIPVALLFVGLGLALWLYYQQIGGLPPPSGESVFPYFIRTVVPSGLKGLLLAAILAAAMSSLDSAINALASVTVSDLFMPLRRRLLTIGDEEEDDYLMLPLCRIFSLVWAGLLMFTALVLGYYHRLLLEGTAASAFDVTRKVELLSLALGVMSLIYGPLLAVFLIGIFTKRGSSMSLAVGILAGLLTTSFLKFSGVVEIGWTWHTCIGCLVTFSIAVLDRGRAYER